MSSSNSRPRNRQGAILASLHLLGFILTVAYVNLSADSQSGAVWLIWSWVDFPWSLIYLAAGPGYSELLASVSAYSVPLANAIYLPYVIHGVLGTIWWYFLPRIVGAVKRRIMRT